MKTIIICDIDGTLADCSHRRYFVEPSKVPEVIGFCITCSTIAGKSHKPDCSQVKDWKPDWESFFREDLVMQDKVIIPVKVAIDSLVKGLDNYNDPAHVAATAELYFVTGRMEKHRDLTVRWLIANRIFNNAKLYMRADDDFRSDEIVKEEILHKHIGVENVFCVFDDRKRVVDMWRRNGLMCLQVAEGDF